MKTVPQMLQTVDFLLWSPSVFTSFDKAREKVETSEGWLHQKSEAQCNQDHRVAVFVSLSSGAERTESLRHQPHF